MFAKYAVIKLSIPKAVGIVLIRNVLIKDVGINLIFIKSVGPAGANTGVCEEEFE